MGEHLRVVTGDRPQPRPLSAPGRPMTLGNMRSLGVRSLADVVHAVPARGEARRRRLSRLRAGAELRTADGVHVLRRHRRRRAAELARASRAAESHG
jgi:hypothetical protein